MELRQLECFLTVVEEDSSTLAARRLRLSRPTTTTTIKQLERDVDAPLFAGLNSPLMLNPNGGIVAEQARRICGRPDLRCEGPPSRTRLCRTPERDAGDRVAAPIRAARMAEEGGVETRPSTSADRAIQKRGCALPPHRLPEIVVGVPNIAATAAYYADLVLSRSIVDVASACSATASTASPDDDDVFSAVDGGKQLRIMHSSQRRMVKIGTGADDPGRPRSGGDLAGRAECDQTGVQPVGPGI